MVWQSSVVWLRVASATAALCCARQHCSLRLRKVSRLFDTLSGFAIQGLYLTYFTVAKGMLSVFACTTKSNGASVLTAEPSLSCNNVSVFLLLISC